MAQNSPDFLTNVPVETYVPVPFPANYPRPDGTAPTTGGGSTGGTGGDDSTVYAAALFLRATCKATDKVGAWVRADTGASAVTTTTSSLSYPAIGVIVSKGSDTSCVVQTYGLCVGLYSGLTPNLRLFVGPTGLATIGSQLPSGTAYVQPIGFSVRADTIFVQPSGTLYRRDASASDADPAPSPSPSDDSTSTYRPILGGSEVPDASIGQSGDLYLKGDTLQLYGPKNENGWGDPRPLATASTTPGPQGEPGSRIARVTYFPSDVSAFREGDILIDDDGNLAQVVNT